MKKALKILLLGLMASTMLATASFAEWVYVTKSGKKFHHEASRYAKMEGVERISMEEAIELGYEPSKAFERYQEALEEEEKASKKK